MGGQRQDEDRGRMRFGPEPACSATMMTSTMTMCPISCQQISNSPAERWATLLPSYLSGMDDI